MSKSIQLPPEAGRLIEGLRDTGYTFETSVADIIDNSLAAEADVIHIDVKMDWQGNIRVMIADDGTGMDHDGLMNAMKYGSEKKDDPNSLGKFGLGMKTSSTAFARKLSVLTRSREGCEPEMAVWDLDHVAQKKSWECLWLEPDKAGLDLLNKISNGGSGTVIIWDNIDRLLKHSDPASKAAKAALTRHSKNLESHLAEVFERFLDGNNKNHKDIKIYLNGQGVLPWNPFCENEGAVMVQQEKTPVELPDKSSAEFSLTAWVIPPASELDTAAKGRVKISNERQGFYVYRHGRMIQAATTMKMWKKEPHLSLLRIEFDFDHRLDDAFAIDIKKSQVTLNSDLWRHINDNFLAPPKRAAQERYRQGRNTQTNEIATNAHKKSNDIILDKEGDLDTPVIDVVDVDNNEVVVTNPKGKAKIRLKIGKSESPDKVTVIPKSDVEYNQLYEPAVVDGHKAVYINTSHDYYRKVYVPNLKDGVVIPGMDSLLWALSVAELRSLSEKSAKHFEEMRIELSRLLSRLVEDLPEPDLDDLGQGAD